MNISEILKEWVRNIFITVLIVSFIEIVLPSGKMRKYLKFILSIIVLAVILQPLLDINDIDINAFANMNIYDESELNDIESNSIESVQQLQIINLYKEKIKNEINIIIKNTLPEAEIQEIIIHIFDDVNKKNFGEIHSIHIRLNSTFMNETDASRIIKEIANALGTSEKKISIKIVD